MNYDFLDQVRSNTYSMTNLFWSAERIPDILLHSFTTAFRATLPLEIRREVYSHLFTKDVIDTMSLSAQPSPDNYPICYTTYTPDDIRWPRFVKPGVINEEVAIEIVQSFFEVYKDFEVTNPKEIEWFLKQDFFTRFGFGVTPSQGIISKITVDGCLDPGNMDFIDATKIAEHFSPLLDEKQKWSPDFRLKIRLWTKFRPWWRYNVMDIWADHKANVISAVLCELRPILQKVQVRGGKVSVVMEVGRKHKLAVTPAQMSYSEEEWIALIKNLG